MEWSKILMICGALAFGMGLWPRLGGGLPPLGRLPGDWTLRRGSFTFYFPFATSILISVLLTLVWNLFRK
ncbi:MAG: DUF2905 domain-containing protein [Myxococcales bacterium]|nr:DUF2905 domain-containing protein [Myxococcales bacterium]